MITKTGERLTSTDVYGCDGLHRIVINAVGFLGYDEANHEYVICDGFDYTKPLVIATDEVSCHRHMIAANIALSSGCYLKLV